MRPAKVCILRSASGWLSHEAFHTNRDPTTTAFSFLKPRIPVLKKKPTQNTKKLFLKNVCELWCLIYEEAYIQLKFGYPFSPSSLFLKSKII